MLISKGKVNIFELRVENVKHVLTSDFSLSLSLFSEFSMSLSLLSFLSKCPMIVEYLPKLLHGCPSFCHVINYYRLCWALSPQCFERPVLNVLFHSYH